MKELDLTAHPLDKHEHRYPILGRPSVSFEEAEQLLVQSPQFSASSTRHSLWHDLLLFLGEFLELEEKFKEELGGRSLLHHMWLGGSFVSSKLDPRNVDLTLFIDEEARNQFKGQPGSGKLSKLMKSRDKIERDFHVSPTYVSYRKVPHLFDLQQLAAEDSEYFRDRGRWDDWWQRVRVAGEPSPTPESCRPRRGYLEVKL